MVDQITILEEGLKVHSAQCPDQLRPLHEKMEKQFEDMKRKSDQFTTAKRMTFGELPYTRVPSSSKLGLVPVTPTSKRGMDTFSSSSSLPATLVRICRDRESK